MQRVTRMLKILSEVVRICIRFYTYGLQINDNIWYLLCNKSIYFLLFFNLRFINAYFFLKFFVRSLRVKLNFYSRPQKSCGRGGFELCVWLCFKCIFNNEVANLQFIQPSCSVKILFIFPIVYLLKSKFKSFLFL